MFAPWDEAVLADASSGIYIFFNTDDDPRFERRLWIQVRGGTFFARMDQPTGRRDIFGFAQVWQPEASSILVQFPRSLLGRRVDRYRYYVWSGFHRDVHPDCGNVDDMVNICFDRAPDAGTIFHARVPA